MQSSVDAILVVHQGQRQLTAVTAALSSTFRPLLPIKLALWMSGLTVLEKRRTVNANHILAPSVTVARLTLDQLVKVQILGGQLAFVASAN